MSEEKLTVKESKEFLEGLGLLGAKGVAIAKGGLGVDDIPHVVSLAKDFEVLQKAVEGINLVDDELKNLDEAEAIELVACLFGVIKKIREAAK